MFLELVEHFVFDGTHYRRTAEAWLANMDRNAGRVRAIFAATYGIDDASRFFAYWRIFFMACAGVWGYRKGSEWLVSHYRFRKSRALEVTAAALCSRSSSPPTSAMRGL